MPARNRKEYMRLWRIKNKDKIKQYMIEWRSANKEHLQKYDKLRRNNNQEGESERFKKYRNEHLECLKKKSRVRTEKYRQKIKEIVIDHYSCGGNRCSQCGFCDIRALDIDHINNNGNVERKEKKLLGGSTTYLYLIRNKFPEGYQVLCKNCNWIKHVEHAKKLRMKL